MEENHAEWLPHLASEVVADVHGNLLDAYAVALEGWRRGLTLRWHVKDSEKFKDMITWYVDRPGQLFSLSSEERTHYFFRTRGDKVSNEAVMIGKDKDRTKQVLEEQGVSVPKGRRFKEHETNETVIEYVSNLGYPVVVKPTDGSFGRGVLSNIKSEGELEYSLDYVRNELQYKDIIVEQYIPGKEYRMYVVGDEVVGAMNRIPPNVTGDGINSIKALIELKNEERSLNPRLISCPIIVNEEVIDYIGKFGYTLDSTLETGKTLFLSDKTNISLGGDPIDVMDNLAEDVKRTAVQAVRAIPGLNHGAVDLIVHEATNNVYIIEINPTAQLGGLLYPIKGNGRDIPKAIIDFYFPETKNKNRNPANVYFDLKDVLNPLANKTAVVTQVSPFDYYDLIAKRYVLVGEVEQLVFHQWLKIRAMENQLIGYINKLDSETIEIIVAGTDELHLNNFKDVLNNNDRFTASLIGEEDFRGPIKVGFEIQGEKRDVIDQLKEIQREISESKKELKSLDKKHQDMLNSRSWKLTLPIRKVTGMFKQVYRSISSK